MDLSNENVVHKKANGVEYLQFKKLLEYPEIEHCYVIGTDVDFRIYTGEKNILSKKSYREICDILNIDYNNIVNTSQKHTDNIQIINEKVNINEPDFNVYEATDGLMTDKPGIVLSTINADCILLIFYDPVKKVIANVHSGWRGTLQRISTKTVEKMIKEYGSKPENIICCMSPSIRKDHFEVDKDVYETFRVEFNELADDYNKIFEKKQADEEKYNIDTVLINRLILRNAGLSDENIIDSGICSVCYKDFMHSYRACGEAAGRNTMIIRLGTVL